MRGVGHAVAAVTPAEAGVHFVSRRGIDGVLDSGFRQNDGGGAARDRRPAQPAYPSPKTASAPLWRFSALPQGEG